MNVLVTKGLVKRFKTRTVVDHVDLRVQSGEVVGLLGANGAGKTTCFYMIVGLLSCDQGNIYLDNQDITHLPMHVRAQMGLGYLPQEPSVFRKLTVEQNIMAVLETNRRLTPALRTKSLHALLDELNIGPIRNSLGLSLSGGERRRVEIARALAAEPSFILLDEPFAGVDPKSVIDIQQIVFHLIERNIGVLITDHNVRETLGICTRAYILNEGALIKEGTADAILSDKQVRDVYLGEHFSL